MELLDKWSKVRGFKISISILYFSIGLVELITLRTNQSKNVSISVKLMK